jgi:hypothetical protein
VNVDVFWLKDEAFDENLTHDPDRDVGVYAGA